MKISIFQFFNFIKSTAGISYLGVFVNPGETKLFTISKGSFVKVDIEYHSKGTHYVHVVNNPIYGNDPTHLDNKWILCQQEEFVYMMGRNDKMFKEVAGNEHKVYTLPSVNGPVLGNTLRPGDVITITNIVNTPYGVFGKLSHQTLNALYFDSSIGYVLLSSNSAKYFQEINPL